MLVLPLHPVVLPKRPECRVGESIVGVPEPRRRVDVDCGYCPKRNVRQLKRVAPYAARPDCRAADDVQNVSSVESRPARLQLPRQPLRVGLLLRVVSEELPHRPFRQWMQKSQHSLLLVRDGRSQAEQHLYRVLADDHVTSPGTRTSPCRSRGTGCTPSSSSSSRRSALTALCPSRRTAGTAAPCPVPPVSLASSALPRRKRAGYLTRRSARRPPPEQRSDLTYNQVIVIPRCPLPSRREAPWR